MGQVGLLRLDDEGRGEQAKGGSKTSMLATGSLQHKGSEGMAPRGRASFEAERRGCEREGEGEGGGGGDCLFMSKMARLRSGLKRRTEM